MKRLLLTGAFVLGFGLSVSAYTINGDGSVTLDYGDSLGSVAADFNMNYNNLGYYNGLDADYAVVQPGQTLYLGESSYSSLYGGEHPDYGYSNQAYSGSTAYTPNYSTDAYGYTINTNYYDSPYYGEPAYNEYSTEYSYYDENGMLQEGYETLAADGSKVVYGTVTDYNSVYDTVIGTASCAIGYSGNAGVNVSRACELNNNIVIPAGGTYSASTYIGAGDASMGFVEATCLNSDGTTFEAYGGGICPVTTYIYQAGRDAGLDVVKRQEHQGGDSYTCPYAPNAEDQAMYNYGTSDLVMVNNTGKDIVLNCSYVNGVISATWSE